MSELNRYPWSGHSAAMGRRTRGWQDVEYVLSWFGERVSEAREECRCYVVAGIKDGRRDDLMDGGLIRPLVGWSQVLSLRRDKDKVLSDELILGQDQFVKQILSEADELISHQLSMNERRINAQKRILDVRLKKGVNFEELRGGSRRGCLSDTRSQLALELVVDHGLTMAETARQLGVSSSSISRIFERKSEN